MNATRARRPAAPARRAARFLAVPLAALFVPVLPLAAQEATSGGAVDTGSAASVAATPAAGTPAHRRQAPRIDALRMESGEAIELDGRLDEAAWERAPTATAFLQREPDEGAPATQPTEVHFLHDGETLYVGARMHDTAAAAGVTARLVRRDGNAESDELVLTFDPFHDHVSQTRFSINPAGVRGDAYGPGGSNPDASWDPVWRAETTTDSLGWTAELAIPFSQLRFPRDSTAIWGLQISRTVKRLNEVSVWSFWGLDEQGGPSRFGHLERMSGIQAAATRLEVLPYAVGQVEARSTVRAGDPFRSGTEFSQRLGADLTYLLDSNLTLNATFNPDFGQVEVDPAVVNLSAFETFFPEKREFFIQGQGRFGFGGLWCIFCSNVSSLGMLHTRRIGRAPQAGGLARARGEWTRVPDATTILGAAKLTGQTGGLSLGMLGAVTDREEARVMTADGRVLEQEVEPLTGYFVTRPKKDFLDGELQLGGIFTGVVRDFADPALAGLLNRHSEAAGVDAEYWWGDHTYHLLFSGAVTNVSGTEEAILRAQRSSARYLQRPDREHGGNGLFTDRYDPGLNSMRGWGTYARVAKDGGNWRWETALNVRSPGFENNDIAFLSRTDFVWMNANVMRSWTEPTSWYRRLAVIVGGQQEFNFDGDLTGRQVQGFLDLETPFYWNLTGFLMQRPSRFDDRLTRGGPVVKVPDETIAHAFVSTDSRKQVVLGVGPQIAWDDEGGNSLYLPLDITIKPRSNVSLTLSPTYQYSHNTDQYVTVVEDPTAADFYGHRYVFADHEQRGLSMPTRLNVTFRPGMSLELYAQPLISANDFFDFKEFVAPRGLEKQVYGEDVGSIRSEGEGEAREYFVDPDGAGPAEEFSFGERDFNFRSLRGNVVFRWEWRPGSTLYLVWTQDRSAEAPFGDLVFDRDTDALWAAPGDDIFLVKATWWLGI